MREDFVNTFIQLSLCPGHFSRRDSTCKQCKYFSKGADFCPESLKQDAAKLLKSLYDSTLAKSGETETKPVQKAISKELRVSELLLELGIPTNLLGYTYLKEAVLICWEDPSVSKAITGVLYPKIAEKFNTNNSRTERAIRHAIEKAWDYKISFAQTKKVNFVCSPNKGKPTNSEFISAVVEYLRLEDLN